MYKKTNKIVLIELILCLALFGGAQTRNSAADSKPVNLTVDNTRFSDIQRLLDEQAAHGFQVSGVSYHSKLRNLYRKGQLEISLKTGDSAMKYQYRALTTELRPSILQQALNSAGEKGFHLLRETPIPLEAGLLRPQDMFVTIMEKSNETPKVYQYLVMAYRYRSYEQKRIKQALKEGYVKVCDSQLGQTTYLIMEKVTG